MPFMPRRILSLLLLFVAAVAAADEPTRTVTLTFEGRTFTLEVPASYTQEQTGDLGGMMKTWGFATEAREDGTRAMVQVSIVKGAVPLDGFASAMLAGVERRRSEWKVERTDIEIGGAKATRHAWSGIADLRGVPTPLRGVMLHVVVGGFAISLHTQDLEQYAKETLPRGEAALRTFRIR